jgi:hypothetical protein
LSARSPHPKTRHSRKKAQKAQKEEHDFDRLTFAPFAHVGFPPVTLFCG